MKNKSVIVVSFIINIIVIIALLIGLIYFLMGGGTRLGKSGEYEIRKEEEVAIQDIENLEFDFKSDSIHLYESDNENLRIIQKSKYELGQDEVFKIERNGTTMRIIGQYKTMIRFFSIGWADSEIEIYLPKEYTKNLALYSSSGDIESNKELNNKDIKIKQTSGNITIEKLVVVLEGLR